MSINESATKLEKELAAEGITEEYIINTYGSVDNWIDSIAESMKNAKKLG